MRNLPANCIVLFFQWLTLLSCSAQGNLSDKYVEQEISFPGAEGFGKYTKGGRGGRVIIVSNLNDQGPGSFRSAAEAKDKRIIVFAVSGTVHLESKLVIRADVTIAGQTAPGDGICLADQPVALGGDNIIIRYLRFRMGDKYQRQAGKVDGSGSDDALSGSRRKNILVDHCSLGWSTDEVFSIYGGDSTTLQWNIISEPLNYSYHFEKGDKDFEHHGFGGIWGGLHLAAHHNLFAHCTSRNPRFNGTRLGATKEFADYRNNVVYNWGTNTVYGGEAGEYNVVSNYFKYGPSTNKNVRYRIVNPSRTNELGFGKYYVTGNYVDGAESILADNTAGVHMGNGGSEADRSAALVKQAFPAEPILTEPATEAYASVLAKAGASWRRDTLDQRIIEDVKNRTGKHIDVQGGYPHGTAYELTVNAWPALASQPAPVDKDQDGMPDEWERQNGLNATDPTDAGGTKLHRHYTNIEMYINSIVK